MSQNYQEDQRLSYPEFKESYYIYARDSGYIQDIEKEELIKICQENNLRIRLLIPSGIFLLNCNPFLQINKEIKDKELKDKILNCFIFYTGEFVEENYIFGIKQITEIAVKALSPGINDPATALNAIDFLSDIFVKTFIYKSNKYLLDDNKNIVFIYKLIKPEKLIYYSVSEILNYGNKDFMIILKLMHCLKSLLIFIKEKEAICDNDIIIKYMIEIINQADIYIKNKLDRQQINRFISNLNQNNLGYVFKNIEE